VLVDFNADSEDLFDFTAFPSSPSYGGNIVSGGAGFGLVANGEILVLYSALNDTSTDVNEAAEIAAEFAGGIAAGGSAVVISGEDVGAGDDTAYVWYVQDDGSGTIDAVEVSLVGTIANFNVGTLESTDFIT